MEHERQRGEAPDPAPGGQESASGDVDRFSTMWGAYAHRIHAYATRHVGTETAQEVVAETFLVAWRRLQDIPGDPLPWLIVVARNTIANGRRSLQRVRTLEAELARLERVASPVATGPERVVVDREVTRLAPIPDHEAVDAARAQVMAAVADGAGSDSAPDDSDNQVVPLDRARPARRVALRLGIAASLIAASVTGVTLWPHPTDDWVPAAYADWRASPDPLPSDEAQIRADACLAQATEPGPDGPYSGPSVAGLDPVLAERRGNWTFLILAASGEESRTGMVVSCLSSSSGEGAISRVHGSGSGLPPDEIQPRVTNAIGDQVSVWGETGDDVSRVTATLLNGAVVDATVSGGYFAAWWPSGPPSDEGPEAYTLTWYLTDGTQSSTYRSPPEP